MAFAAAAPAADPAAGLSDAEAQAAGADAEIAAARGRVGSARADHTAAKRRAANPESEAVAARRAVRDLRAELTARERRAEAEVAALEAQYNQEEEDHDREVSLGIGFGLAALVGLAIALGWRRFRSASPVAALAALDLGRALALTLGGGLLLIVIGAALGGAGGVGGAIGGFCVGLGLVLAVAPLLARQSARVADGRSKPALGRERVPDWVPGGVAALFALLALASFGTALFAESPDADFVPEELQAETMVLSNGPEARQLERDEADAEAAEEMAAKPLARRRATAATLRRATGELQRAERRLASAEANERRFSRRLAAVEEQEEREATREAEQAQREAEERQEEESQVAGCDPNYSGCVPSYPPDVNCADVGETVTVIGSDPHGLDADGDLVACE